MSKKIGKYRIGKYEEQKYVDQLTDVSLDATQPVDANVLNSTGVISASAGILNSSLSDASATSNLDISDVSTDHKLFVTGKVTGSIKLPQATANNVGMKIDVLIAGGSVTGSIGFANGGSTVLNSGVVSLYSTNAKMDAEVLTTSVGKQLFLAPSPGQGDAVKKAGGAEGSVYKFVYQAANTVHLEAVGLLDDSGTPALVGGELTSSTGL